MRWTTAAIAGVQMLVGAGPTTLIAVAVVLLLVAVGAVVQMALRRLQTSAAWRQFGAAVMTADVVITTIYLTGAVAVDADLAWAVLILLLLEGALRYRLRGGTYTAGGAAVGYILIEIGFGGTAGLALVNRAVLLVLIGAFAGAMARELDIERQLFQRMAHASQDIAAKRNDHAILSTFASHVAAALGSSQVLVYSYDTDGFTIRASHLRASGGIVHDAPLLGGGDVASALLHRITWRPAGEGAPARLTLPIRLPERPAALVAAVAVPGQRPGGVTEGALLSLAEATAVSLATLDVLRHQEASNRRLQRLEVLRTRFVATVAHDLRSPLTTVKGVASILRDRRDTVPPERVDAMLESVERQANRLNRLADDLLDAARLDSDQLELKIGEVDLGTVLDAVAADAADEVEVVMDHPVRLRADGARLERVVWNLVSNALKYGRAPVILSATAQLDAGTARIRVRDHGGGLSAAQTDSLFTDFAAGEDPDSVGLGLAIVWQLVRAHGGTVSYADAEPGACFTVTIPTGACPPPQGQVVVRAADGG